MTPLLPSWGILGSLPAILRSDSLSFKNFHHPSVSTIGQNAAGGVALRTRAPWEWVFFGA